jgi:uncharacterized membrane protein YkvA (DUF1232 family)
MSDQNQSKRSNLPPQPWGSEPIRGLNYDYLDIERPPAQPPKAVIPKVTEYNALAAQDFYQRTRAKIVAWAEGAGAGRNVTKYILLVPDIMALFVRLMGDSRVSAAVKAEIAAASAYIIVPVDLMPEAVMGPAGLIDDAIVGVYAMNRVVKAMGQAGEDVLRQYWDGDDDVLIVMKDLLEKADQFVTGRVWSGIKKFMASAAQEIKSVASDVATSAQQARTEKPRGPVIEGSYRPILPPNEQKGTQAGPDDDQWIIPPNERRRP